MLKCLQMLSSLPFRKIDNYLHHSRSLLQNLKEHTYFSCASYGTCAAR